jgi:hypothetical protein
MSGRLARGIAVAAAAVAISVAALLLSPSLPGPTDRGTVSRFVGTGATLTTEIAVPEGWYEVSWAATAFGEPPRGCLFGLQIDETNEVVEIDREEPFRFGYSPKLAYRSLRTGTGISGSSGPLRLGAGSYRFIVDGSCSWQVLLRTSTDKERNETDGPRMNVEQAER